MRLTRRRALGQWAGAAAGAAGAIWLNPLGRLWTPPAVSAASATTPGTPIPGWLPYVHSEMGVAFQYPQGWTVRILESGQASMAEGRDGLSGARAYSELFTVQKGTSSATLIYIIATNLGLLLDGFRAIEGVRLSAKPDLSAIRYVYNGADGLRKGTLTLEVNGGGAVAMGFDAPAALYAQRLHTLGTAIGTFRWFESSLGLQQAFEPREHAFSVMVPKGWTPDLKVIRPAVDAGWVFRVSDAGGQVSAEVRRPQTPSFAVPGPSFPIPEGQWYHYADRWGWQPLLVYRYLPAKDYLRWFLLPTMQPGRPGLALLGLGDRPDLALTPETQAIVRAFGGGAAGAEAEYVWTRRDGARMHGRALAVTVFVPLPGGRGLGNWSVPHLMLAEGPDARYSTAVSAMITLNTTFQLDAAWYRAEIAGARKRWQIIMSTERELFNKFQETLQHRQDVALKAAEEWDTHIRYTFSGSSDYGAYVPIGADKVLTQDGRVVSVVDLGGKSVEQWQAANPNGYLQKVW
ncbi:MAG: hypothetical protein ACYDAB_17620 [bacterium]